MNTSHNFSTIQEALHFDSPYLNKKGTDHSLLLFGATIIKSDPVVCVYAFFALIVLMCQYYLFLTNSPWFLCQIKFLYNNFEKFLVTFHKLVLMFGNYVCVVGLLRCCFNITWDYLPDDCLLLLLICTFLHLQLYSLSLKHWQKCVILVELWIAEQELIEKRKKKQKKK